MRKFPLVAKQRLQSIVEDPFFQSRAELHARYSHVLYDVPPYQSEEVGKMYELLKYMTDGGSVLGMPNKQKYSGYANIIEKDKPVEIKVDGQEVTVVSSIYCHGHDESTGKTTVSLIILISSDEKSSVISLAHELGHAIDVSHNSSPIRQPDGKFNHEWNQEEILKKEQNAWGYSVEILNQVQFKDWDRFREEAERSYGSYVTSIIPEKDQQKEMMYQFSKELAQRLEQVLEIEMK